MTTVADDDLLGCQLWIRVKRANQLLATLSRMIPQVRLDLAFDSAEKVKIFTVNPGKIYVTGYYIPEEEKDNIEQDQVDENGAEVKYR